jgi:hypothetical protein
MYNRESHFVVPPSHVLAVDDRFEVIRGNGPREGDVLGVATITGFEDGAPALWLRPDGSLGGRGFKLGDRLP